MGQLKSPRLAALTSGGTGFFYWARTSRVNQAYRDYLPEAIQEHGEMTEDQKIPWKDRPWKDCEALTGWATPENGRIADWVGNYHGSDWCVAFLSLIAPPPKPKVLTWRDVLDQKAVIANLESLRKAAYLADYHYFCFKDRIFRVTIAEVGEGWRQTSWTTADIDAGKAIVEEDA